MPFFVLLYLSYYNTTLWFSVLLLLCVYTGVLMCVHRHIHVEVGEQTSGVGSLQTLSGQDLSYFCCALNPRLAGL